MKRSSPRPAAALLGMMLLILGIGVHGAIAQIPAAEIRGESRIDCLLETEGRIVRWDRDWQKDGQDNNVQYRIADVQILEPKKGPRGVSLSLEALGPAVEPRRTAKIVKALAAELFCSRVSGSPSAARRDTFEREPEPRPAKPVKEEPVGTEDAIYPTEEVSAIELPYRRSVAGRWVITPLPKSVSAASYICVIGAGQYSCGAEDFQRSQDELARHHRVVRPLRKYRIDREFLKHTDHGWVRDAAIGADPNAVVSSCVVGSRVFACLETDRARYGQELAELAELAELEQQIFPPAQTRPPTAEKKPGKAGSARHQR